MASPLELQFAFVTWRLPDASLPDRVEIVLGATLGDQLPVKVPVTLVHGWIARPGAYEFGFRITQPNGLPLELSNPDPLRANLARDRPFYISFHHVDLLVLEPGRFQIEALCNEELALRYPFFIWERSRLS